MVAVALCSAAGSSAVSTTGLLLASFAPGDGPVLLVECDPSGGDVAAWAELGDRQGLASLTSSGDRSLGGLAAHVQRLPSGVAVLVAPCRATQAGTAVREVSGWLVPSLAADRSLRAVLDAGRVDPGAVPVSVSQADLVVVVVGQCEGSAPATSGRVYRTEELIARLDRSSIEHALVVVGAGPYRPDDLAAHVGSPLVGVLPHDPRGACAVAGGWTLGRSAGRSVLAGAARELAGAVFARVADRTVTLR